MDHDIVLGLSRYSRDVLKDLGAKIKVGMKDNAYFTSITTQITEYITAYDNFIAAIPPANISNEINEAECDAKCEIFKTEYKALGNFVRGVAKGDELKLKSSGYTMKKKPQSWSIPETPKNVDAFSTNDVGSLMVTCKPEKQVSTYIARASTDKINCTENFDTSSKVVITGLRAGVTLYVQMQAKNSAGKSGWSNPIEARLQPENEPTIKKVNYSSKG